MTPEELSPSEYARRIGTSTRTVQRWIAQQRLPARRVGGRWRVAFDASGASERGQRRVARREIGTLFVANRGEVATRIERTCRRLGVTCVLPVVDGPESTDLLDIQAVVAAAVSSEADAIHPGYGFLAESAAFAEAVIAAGLGWVGPPPAAIRAMGDKAAARRLAASLGVPVVTGYDGPTQDDATLQRAARRIGYPLLIKPAAGGGGKGMRVVGARAELEDALAAARREATAAFGDDRLILEWLVEGGRHVEVQILADDSGAVVHLGERDCSVQRRHQKVLEETPSQGVDVPTRAALGAAAIALARAVGYRSAGTCEFLLADDGSWTFLEMNTRLQVEHPVTELVTGRDLVADQLRIAAGDTLAALGLTSDGHTASGHAIEVRLYAEDAEAGFLPATGRVEALHWPSGPGIRVDAGIALGDDVSGRFDPMLAKVIAHGTDRPEALHRLAAALDATVVLGVVTNLRFLRWLVRQPWLLDGGARIDTLDQTWRPGEAAAVVAIPEEAWADAARALAPADATDPWASGWRVDGAAAITLQADDGSRRRIAVEASAGPAGRPIAVVDDRAYVDVDGRSVAIELAAPPDVDRAASAARAHHPGGPAAAVIAPMPGRVVTVHATLGAHVDGGDPVATLEAMKMEHAVRAPIGGIVTSLEVRLGDQVQRGQVIASVEP